MDETCEICGEELTVDELEMPMEKYGICDDCSGDDIKERD